MKKQALASLLGCCLICGGSTIMAEEIKPVLDWVRVGGEDEHFFASFPQAPVKMHVDLPFENTPPQASLDFYSTPTAKGLFALALFSPMSEAQEWIDAESFQLFFENSIGAYFFFDPTIFENKKAFFFAWDAGKEGEQASFRFDLEDSTGAKRLEGVVKKNHQTVCVAFYLAHESGFDRASYGQFISSLILP